MNDRFAHAMPFGATCGDGRVRFRLWAPVLRSLAVHLPKRKQSIPMTATGDGWFELVTDAAAPGDEYRFQLPDGQYVPDPASRRQAADVHDASVVVDPRRYRWRHPQWRGRPWHEAVVYELHVGTFSPEATFDGVRVQLPRLADLGITAVELMPIADFSGRWNWGYDGVLPYAPDTRYGTPGQLKALVDAAHELGLMIFLDVVYNHFGPDGNYLSLYAPQTFTEKRPTPWGAGIDYTRRPVRDFFIHNALYWIQEYRFDGLRLDAVHQIVDESTPHLLLELAYSVREAAGPDRQIHLILENENNSARLIARDDNLRPRHYTAQWNDDFHHAAHVLLTGETDAYYADYAKEPLKKLGRALAEGFVYQGELSVSGKPRGEPSASLPLAAFVNCLQNHDQVGNRALGERLITLADPSGLRAMASILLLAPSIPMLFMGEELGTHRPFCFFSDFQGDLGDAVREGRRREFAKFPHFSDPASREKIPDPQAESTYRASVIPTAPTDAAGRQWLNLYRDLLAIRRAEIVPRLAGLRGGQATCTADPTGWLKVQWQLGDGSRLSLLAHLSSERPGKAPPPIAGRKLWSTAAAPGAWFAAWFLEDATAG